MGSKRSGPRKIREPDEELKLPPLGKSYDSIVAYCAAVNRAVVTRQIDPRWADALIAGARLALRAVERKSHEGETLELKKMLTEAQKVARSGRAHEVAERQHADKPDEP